MGCATLSVGHFVPHPDGSVDLSIWAERKVPSLRVKSGTFSMRDQTDTQQILRWRAGEPVQGIDLYEARGRAESESETPAAVTGTFPYHSVPVSLCGAPAGQEPTSAQRSEDDQVLWCFWHGSARGPRVEARVPSAPAPAVAIELEEPDGWPRLAAIGGQRAVLLHNKQSWLLDAAQGTVTLLTDSRASLLGATPQGDVLLSVIHEPGSGSAAGTAGAAGTDGAGASNDPVPQQTQHAVVLLLRAHKGGGGERKVAPQSPSAQDVAAAGGAVWIYDRYVPSMRLQKIDPVSGRATLVRPPAPAGHLLGADATGWLWFQVDGPTIRPCKRLPVLRWNPATDAREIVSLPTC